jgi:hypothetical protein
MNKLWEILVPANDNSGVEFSLEKHHQWDEFVRKITGGLTILKASKGQWTSETGHIFQDKMIPVRITCSNHNILMIAKFTKEFYDQEKVMYYQVSSNVRFYP